MQPRQPARGAHPEEPHADADTEAHAEEDQLRQAEEDHEEHAGQGAYQAPRASSAGGAERRRGGAPSGPAPMTDAKGLKPYSGEAPSAGLPGVLPTPEIAADPNAYRNPSGGTAAMPQTRLISPVAANGREGNGQLLLVAAAAGAAGAVGALNLSVAYRALRRRRAAR